MKADFNNMTDPDNKMTDSVLILRGLEELYPELRFIERLRHCVETYPGCNWGDAMSRGQITSKIWIIHELLRMDILYLGRVGICGGWLGILSRLMLDDQRLHTSHIHSMDTDLSGTIVAGELNYEYIVEDQFVATLTNCYDVHYGDYDTIINTSCEHFTDFKRWWVKIPERKLVVLQSNDFTEPEDHVDCVLSAEELAAKAGMSTVLFQGALPCIKYTRFMVIGVK